MKKIYASLFLLFLLFTCQSSSGQSGTWTWVNGENTANVSGVFGTQGVASVNNYPPANYLPAQWTDLQGNFWMFGGNNLSGYLSALWKYDPITTEWTWMKGPATANFSGNYGSQGISSPTNLPPSRGLGMETWVDTSGDLWMFGGYRSQVYNDLWRYNIASNEWTWMKGHNGLCDTGYYGIKGVENPLNNPPPRYQNQVSWTDNDGNFWLFGGYNNCFNKSMNDLWVYKPATNNWTWMSGSNLPNQPAVYGTKGVAAPGNAPGARMGYARWKDEDGNLWLFGGMAYIHLVSYDVFNDMWKYDIASGQWTWVSGTNVHNDAGSESAYCTRTGSEYPRARAQNSSAAVNGCGKFYTFGGATETVNDSCFNDLWMYDPLSNEWARLFGSSAINGPSSYGTKNVAAPSNLPMARGGAVSWTDNDGNFYVFGGYKNGHGYFNDLWKYVGDTTCNGCGIVIPPPVAALQSNDSVICENYCIDFTDLSTDGPTSWLWTFQGALPPTSTDQHPQSICYLGDGSFSVKLVVTNDGGSDSVLFSNLITVQVSPPTPTITQSNDTLYCSFDASYTSYQWYADTLLIPGATDASLVVSANGNYNVVVTNSNDCSTAVGINITLGLADYYSGLSFSLSPNPAMDKLVITANHKLEKGAITLFNALGEVVLRTPVTMEGNGVQEINIKNLAAGIYVVHLTDEKANGSSAGKWTNRFVKQ